MKIFKRILFGILIVILLICFIAGINMIHKYNIYKKIYNTLAEYASKENFDLKVEVTATEQVSRYEAVYRNGSSYLYLSNGLETWTDGETAYILYDEGNTAYPVELGGELDAYFVNKNYYLITVPGAFQDTASKISIIALSKIKTVKLDETKYYMISYYNPTYQTTTTIYYDMNSYFPVKGKYELPDGTTIDYLYTLKFNIVPLKDVESKDTSTMIISDLEGNIISYPDLSDDQIETNGMGDTTMEDIMDMLKEGAAFISGDSSAIDEE